MGRKKTKKTKKPKRLRHSFRPKRGRLKRQDGDVVAVLRPQNPQRAAKAYAAIQHKVEHELMTAEEASEASFEVIRAQPHTFVGLLSHCGQHILQTNGRKYLPGRRTQPGDGYLPYSFVQESVQAQASAEAS